MTQPIRRLLVANRGEIALRVMRTAHAMGIETVAIYSDVDADAAHVRYADHAVYIGPSVAEASYLAIEKVLAAAKNAAADAIHPGYGFLSENPDFARACEEASLIFVGPRADAIVQMGSKQAAKALAEQAGVPVVPGYRGTDQCDARLQKEAQEIGVPLLIKASAGGGGKGMRRVDDLNALPDALADARSESQRAFGNDTLLLEKYVERPRHIEIQILADLEGHAVHFGERECSIQRRYQKIIEESPSPFVDAALRAKMGADAVRLAEQIGYQNAGTVEFIVDAQGHYFFLEMNTRLQVEHPITEAVYGVDLVRAQLDVAMGRSLPWTQDEIAPRGAAIEARLYAEDPAHGFLPANGQLWRWDLPQQDGLRIDAGVREGDEISTYYDPMIAKIIGFGPTRDEAAQRLTRGLRALQVAGVRTNRQFLLDLLEHPAWRAGDTHTHFISEHMGDVPTIDRGHIDEAALAMTIWDYNQRMRARTHLPHLSGAFRNNPYLPMCARYRDGDAAVSVHYWPRGPRFVQDAGVFEVLSEAQVVVPGEEPAPVSDSKAADGVDATCAMEPARWRYRIEKTRVVLRAPSGITRTWEISKKVGDDGETIDWYAHSMAAAYTLTAEPRFVPPQEEIPVGSCVAPMSGTVLHLMIKAGDAVQAGQTLMVLEAMKMEHRVSAPTDGVVTSLAVAQGDAVHQGVMLAVVDGDAGD